MQKHFLQVFGNILLDPEEALDRSNNFRTFFEGVMLLFRQVKLKWFKTFSWGKVKCHE
jgi:hypothetical protein